MTRLDKYVSQQCGITRSESRKLIRRGTVTVFGKTVREPDAKIDENSIVKIGDTEVNYQKEVYLMMNKPKGVVCSTDDKRSNTVLELLSDELRKRKIFPVGRLDKDTTGFLILTTDGEFAHKVISPKHEIYKVYDVVLDGEVTEEMSKRFFLGITLSDGTKCLPCEMMINPTDANKARVKIREGKYHQIKRMFGVVGLGVNELRRISIGNIELDEALNSGEYRELSEEELKVICPNHKFN